MEIEILRQILNKLTAVEQGQTKLEQGQTETNQRLGNLETDVAGLKADIAGLKTEVTRIKESVVLIENDHGKKLGALLDGYSMLTDKVEPLPGAVDALQEDVAVIKAVVTSHSMDINVLKAV